MLYLTSMMNLIQTHPSAEHHHEAASSCDARDAEQLPAAVAWVLGRAERFAATCERTFVSACAGAAKLPSRVRARVTTDPKVRARVRWWGITAGSVFGTIAMTAILCAVVCRAADAIDRWADAARSARTVEPSLAPSPSPPSQAASQQEIIELP